MKNTLTLALALFCACATPANKSDSASDLKILGHDPGQATLAAIFQTQQGPVPGTLSLVELEDAKGKTRVFGLTSAMLFREGDSLVAADKIAEFVTGFRVLDTPGQNLQLESSPPMVLDDIYQLHGEHTRVAVAFPILSGAVHTLAFAETQITKGDKVTLLAADKQMNFITEDSDVHAFGFEFQDNTDTYRGAALVNAEQEFVGMLLDALKMSGTQSVFVVRSEMIHDLLALTLNPNLQKRPYLTQTQALSFERPARWVSKSNEDEAVSIEHGSVSLSVLRFPRAESSCLRGQKELTSLMSGDGDEPNYSDTLPKGIGSRLLFGAQRPFQRRAKEGWAMEFTLLCSDDDAMETIYLLSGKESELEAQRATIGAIRESLTLK